MTPIEDRQASTPTPSLPFRSMPDLAQASHQKSFPEGSMIFVEGESPRGIYLIHSGRVKLSITSAEGKKLIVRIAGPGDLLGTHSSVTGTAYEATAETLTSCRVDFVSPRDLLRLLEQQESLGLSLAIAAGRELSEYIDHARVLFLSDSAGEKVARLLLRLIEQFGETTEDGIRFQTMLSHEEIAHLIGASRETVTRELSLLKRKQIVRTSNGHLFISNRGALSALVGRD